MGFPNTPRIAVIGNTYLDEAILIPRLPSPDMKITSKKVLRNLGGSATNFAVAFLQFPAQCDLYSTIAGSDLGKTVKKLLLAKGIDISNIEMVEGEQGRTIVLITPDAESAKIGIPGVSNQASVRAAKRIDVLRYSHVHLASPEAKAIEIILEKTIPSNTSVSVDIGARLLETNVSKVRDLLEKVDIVFMNRLAYRRLYNVAPPSLPRLSHPSKIVVTMGDEGVFLVSGNETEMISAHKTNPVDTTGAGDILAAYSVYYFLLGDLKYGVKLGNVAAALKIQHIGGTNGIPQIEEVKKWLSLE